MINKIQYVGDGTNKTFAFSWDNNQNVLVYLNNEITKLYDVNDGQVVLATAPLEGDIITLVEGFDVDYLESFRSKGIGVDQLDIALELISGMAKNLEEKVSRAPLVPLTEGESVTGEEFFEAFNQSRQDLESVTNMYNQVNAAVPNVEAAVTEGLSTISNRESSAITSINNKETEVLATVGAEVTRATEQADRAELFAESINPENLDTRIPFTVIEASRDINGFPNYVGVNNAGSKLTFAGNISYVRSDKTFRSYNDLTNINIANGVVMVNEGKAEIVPEVLIQFEQPTGEIIPYVQPVLTKNGTWGTAGQLTVQGYSEFGPFDPDGAAPELTYPYQPLANPSKLFRTSVNRYYEFSLGGFVTVNQIRITNSNNNRHCRRLYVIKSEDGNSGWVTLKTFDTTSGNNATWTADISTTNNTLQYFALVASETSDTTSGDELVEFAKIDIVGTTSTLKAGTVWFNSLNNQAKQYNGAEWVDYNGVPLAEVTDEYVSTYLYGTWTGLAPTFANMSMVDVNKLARSFVRNNISLTTENLEEGVHYMVLSSNTVFNLPTVRDGVYGQIKVILNVIDPSYTVDWGTDAFFNNISPVISTAGSYHIYWDYNPVTEQWVCGALREGA